MMETINVIEALQGMTGGNAKQTAASLADHFISTGLPEEEVITILLIWNKDNKPPLPEAEVVCTVQSAQATHKRKMPQETMLDFPDVITGLAGDFADLYSSYLEAPIHFFYMAFLTSLGSVLADRLTLASEIAPQPRLYTILLGESADDRKSTALNKVTEFFGETLPYEFHTSLGVGSAEGLQRIMEKNNKILLLLDEFKQLVSKCKINSSVLLPFINTLFESNKYESRTKTTIISLDDAHLSILAASTIQTYENIWSSQFTDIGFNNRLFLVPGSGERRYSFPSKVPEKEKSLLRSELRKILDFVGKRLELDITPQALSLYDSWYSDLERSIHSKRLDTYALRLMSLLAVNELKHEIDEETVRHAIALSDWQLRVRRLYDPIDADNEIAKMEEKIRRILGHKGPLKDWEIKKFVNAHKTGLWCYETARNNLLKAKELAKEGKRYLLKLK